MLVRPAVKGAIPVVIVAGFLGAGKTTIINYLLKYSAGSRIGVIVNDFGAINIDALLIASQTDRKMELTNGCVCCSMDGGELDEALNTIVEQQPDVIIIEASGLAEPEDLVQLIILNSNTSVSYGGMAYVIDALNYCETKKRHRHILNHIQAADMIVLTKGEHNSVDKTRMLMDELREVTDRPVIEAQHGQLAPELLFDMAERSFVQPSLLQQAIDTSTEHLHNQYGSLTFATGEPLNSQLFKEYMKSPPRGVYRMKGIIYFGMAGYEQKYIMHSVGGRWDMYAEAWSLEEKPHTAIVVLGVGINKRQLSEDFQSLVGESAHMVDIERYNSSSFNEFLA